MNSNVNILSGNASLRVLDNSLSWTDEKIFFTEAYRIESSLYDDRGLHDCIYSVMGRKFKDLSFADGRTLKKFKTNNDSKRELREYPDGRKFLYIYERIPIFDSFDAEWGDRQYTSVYADINGLNMIHTYCGYKLGSVEIYLGLTKLISSVRKKYLQYLYVQS